MPTLRCADALSSVGRRSWIDTHENVTVGSLERSLLLQYVHSVLTKGKKIYKLIYDLSHFVGHFSADSAFVSGTNVFAYGLTLQLCIQIIRIDLCRAAVLDDNEIPVLGTCEVGGALDSHKLADLFDCVVPFLLFRQILGHLLSQCFSNAFLDDAADVAGNGCFFSHCFCVLKKVKKVVRTTLPKYLSGIAKVWY